MKICCRQQYYFYPIFLIHVHIVLRSRYFQILDLFQEITLQEITLQEIPLQEVHFQEIFVHKFFIDQLFL